MVGVDVSALSAYSAPMSHDQHDEEYIRSHSWEYPTEESRCSDNTEAPTHEPPVALTGSFQTYNRDRYR